LRRLGLLIARKELLGDKIPSNWKIYSDGYVIFSMGPEAWRIDGFLDKCFDDSDPVALEIYKREVRKIYDEQGNY